MISCGLHVIISIVSEGKSPVGDDPRPLAWVKDSIFSHQCALLHLHSEDAAEP